MSKAKFPGLQAKFEGALIEAFGATKNFNYQTVIKSIKNQKETYSISDDEFTDLEKNLSNYIYRAIENSKVMSLGRKKGYRLIEVDSQPSVFDEPTENPPIKDGKIDISKEAFLHFPVTLILSCYFNSRVFSLPTKTTNAKWANPDMFMIRKNKKFEFDDELSLDLEILKKVDSSPAFVLSSLELKYGLTNRTSLLSALSETAINGSWANENWLVFFEEKQSPINLDEDSLDFARSNKIGLIRIRQSDSENKEYDFEVLLQATQRTTLQFNSEFTESRKTLLKTVLTQLKDFDENGSYREQDGDYSKLAVLLLQAAKNLVTQKQLPEKIETFFDEFEKYTIFLENREYIKSFLPTIIAKEKLDSEEFIKKQVGSNMSYDNLQLVLKIIKAFIKAT